MLTRFVQWRRSAIVLAATATVLLYACSTGAGASLLAYGLDARHPPVVVDGLPDAQAIVVFGGGGEIVPGVEPHSDEDRRTTDARLDLAYAVYVAGKSNIFVLSGYGDARRMAAELLERGVPQNRIITDEHSHTTRENALNVHALLTTRHLSTVILVTSASHMPRALGSLTKLGLHPIPVSLADPVSPAWQDSFLPTKTAYYASERYIHEYLGIIAYKLRGWL